MDFRKAYNALNQKRCIDILVRYVIRPRKKRPPHLYWGNLQMVALTGQYYGAPFQGSHRVTHGDPLHPTIFNMVVDAVIRNWATLVAGE